MSAALPMPGERVRFRNHVTGTERTGTVARHYPEWSALAVRVDGGRWREVVVHTANLLPLTATDP